MACSRRRNDAPSSGSVSSATTHSRRPAATRASRCVARRGRRRLGAVEPSCATGTRVYAKAVSPGRSDVALSDEESAAVGQALA